MNPEKPDTKIIAVCGKGGVGKTSISAMLACILASDREKRVLAIDADPAIGLAISLGIDVKRTVDDIRTDLIKSIEKGESRDKQTMLNDLDYELFQALAEQRNLGFLAIGRPESDGCYCQVNHFLKDIIREIAHHFDYVVIDGEAGIEQVNRRVMEMVTHLLLVTDTSAKGRKVVETIEQVARETVRFDKVGLLLNRVRDPQDVEIVRQGTYLPLVGWLSDDETIYRFDREGRNFFELPECPAIRAVRQAVRRFVLEEEQDGAT